MIDDIIAARGSRGQSFSSILLHLQFIDNAASYCLGDANYNLVTDQNFGIFNQVREIIKGELAAKGSGIVLVSDLDAEAAAYPASGIVSTGLHGYNCAAYNGTWSGAKPATIQYLLDEWSRYLALPDVGTRGEYSIGFSTYGDITAMLNAFYANGLRVPQTLGFDVYGGETSWGNDWVSYVNSIKAAYYGSSVPLYGVRIMETEYADLAFPINKQWVTGTNSLPAAINTGAQFTVLGINQWQTTDYFPGVADIYDHTAIAASMNPVAFAYGSK